MLIEIDFAGIVNTKITVLSSEHADARITRELTRARCFQHGFCAPFRDAGRDRFPNNSV